MGAPGLGSQSATGHHSVVDFCLENVSCSDCRNGGIVTGKLKEPNVKLECVLKFCCLFFYTVLEEAARVRCAWTKFQEFYLPLCILVAQPSIRKVKVRFFWL